MSNRKIPIRRFSTSTIENCYKSPGHQYNTRYSLKFFSKTNQQWSQTPIPLEEYKSYKLSDAGKDITLMESSTSGFRNAPTMDHVESRPNIGRCRFFSLYAVVSLTIAFSALAILFAYLSDQYVTSVRKDITHLASEVREVHDKLFLMTNALDHISTGITGMQETQISQNSVKTVVQNELEQYDADKTGRTDFALESAGGQIISTRDTVPYQDGSYSTLLGFTLCSGKNGARSLIQASSLPGECWAFKGHRGSIVIRLLGPVNISGISMEHIPRTISPSGDNTSAPKTFSVYGLISKDDNSGNFLLGTFSYDVDGPALQYFEVQRTCPKPFSLVELVIESNHGNKEYTCVYRLRVHGNLESYEKRRNY